MSGIRTSVQWARLQVLTETLRAEIEYRENFCRLTKQLKALNVEAESAFSLMIKIVEASRHAPRKVTKIVKEPGCVIVHYENGVCWYPTDENGNFLEWPKRGYSTNTEKKRRWWHRWRAWLGGF